MTDQSALRRHIAWLEGIQARRIEKWEQQKAATEALIERRQREIENLKAQLTIGVVR